MALFANEDKFNKEFFAVSKETGIPVSVLKGFTAAESNFNPKAYRAEPHIKDASRGLMQILNRTAQAVGFRGNPEQLFTPVVGLRFGAKYLRGLVAKYPDLSAAIASYNMGSPRPANKSTPIIKKLFGEPGPGWIYANQPYVDRVAAYIAYYQTFERPDPARRASIVDMIKKKDLTTLHGWLRNPLFPFPEVRDLVPASPGS